MENFTFVSETQMHFSNLTVNILDHHYQVQLVYGVNQILEVNTYV